MILYIRQLKIIVEKRMKYEVMRVLCMFDLPVETGDERKEYRVFRKKSHTGGICDASILGVYENMPEQRLCQRY